MLLKCLFDYCDQNFTDCAKCGDRCTHPHRCAGSCADCLHEIQFHTTGGRTEYDCPNMLRYYTCHTISKRASEILYALETIDLRKYPEYRIMSIGCGAAPDLMVFEQISKGKRVLYHGVDIAKSWEEIHDWIEWNAESSRGIDARFDRRDIYDMFAEPDSLLVPYNVVIMQYMIAGHIRSGRAEKIDALFDEIIDKLIWGRVSGSPLLLIINDIDHKSWIVDYFNLFTRKLRNRGISFNSEKRHFEPRDERGNMGSKLYKSNSNKYLSLISTDKRAKYNANAHCSGAQLIIEVYE